MGDSETIIKQLLREGWEEVSRSGSHVTFKKAGEARIITVPHPRKDLGKGLKRAIAKAARWGGDKGAEEQEEPQKVVRRSAGGW